MNSRRQRGKMLIDDILFKKLEKLAMLEIPKEKEEEIRKDLSDILGFVENICSLEIAGDIDDKKPATPLRADIRVDQSSCAQDVLKYAPQAKDGYFIVPKIIE